MNKEFKKLANNPVWASSAESGDTKEISAASPAIVRADGLSVDYSLARGKQLEYQTMNQILRELYAAGKEIKRGVNAWDSEIGYKKGALTLYNNHFYVALTDSTGSVPSSSPTKWARYTEYEGAPDPVRDIEFDLSDPSLIKIKWAQQRDNGARITSYSVAVAGQSPTITTTYSTLELEVASATSLANKRIALAEGQSFTITITPTSSKGTGAAAQATSPPLRLFPPEGGRDLPLAAAGGNKSVALKWEVPSDGGSPITGYIVQWKAEAGGYEEGNKRRIGAATSYKVDGLSNDTRYTFRVRAINAKGEGGWSNEAIATPSFSPYDAEFPTLGAPSLDRTRTRITGETNITPSSTKSTYAVQSIEWQYKPDGETGWRTKSAGASQDFFAGGLAPGWWSVRYRMTAPGGATSGWSGVGRIQIGAAPPEPPQASVVYSPIRPTAANRREQTLTHIVLKGDGGSRILEVELYGESGSAGGTLFHHHYVLSIRPFTYSNRLVPLTTEQFNKDLATMFAQRNKVEMFWSHATGYPRETYKSYVRARNQYGWSDWAESNTLIWGQAG